MKHKKLQFLVPQYKETEKTISFLLNSIEQQVDIDKNDIGVIICSDGGEYIIDNDFLKKYSYDITYVICKHRGVSATRNSALLLSNADYVMFCDADDGFCNSFGVKIILENIKIHSEDEVPMDVLSSKFFYEKYNKDDGSWSMSIYDFNNIYVHGRVYRRDFLIHNQIYFNERIWSNEDCFFNIFVDFMSKSNQGISVPVYCWRHNDNSVTHDEKFLYKTIHQLIYSNDSVVELMKIKGDDEKRIAKSAFDVICKIYLDMNKPDWYLEENKEYKDITLKTLKWYIKKNGDYCSYLSDSEKKDILQNAREKNPNHYTHIEMITFNNFIKMVMSYGEQE